MMRADLVVEVVPVHRLAVSAPAFGELRHPAAVDVREIRRWPSSTRWSTAWCSPTASAVRITSTVGVTHAAGHHHHRYPGGQVGQVAGGYLRARA